MFPETIAVSRRTSFQGPLPPPALLREYNQVMPGLAERIVGMAEAEGTHRRKVERSLVRLSHEGLFCGATIALVVIVGSLIILREGKTIGGLAGVLGTLTALVTVFIFGRGKSPPADTTAEQEADEGEER
jgi:uncharacterized membrane protein